MNHAGSSQRRIEKMQEIDSIDWVAAGCQSLTGVRFAGGGVHHRKVPGSQQLGGS